MWLTGLPASGKSTIAVALERKLVEAGRPAYLLDGDNVRHGLSDDLGFEPGDRSEHIRRVAHVARLLADAGVVAVVSLVSPMAADRKLARELHDAAGLDFHEVFVVHLGRGVRAPRPEGPVREGARRQAPRLHRRRLPHTSRPRTPTSRSTPSTTTATPRSRACSRRSACDASHAEPVPRAPGAGIIHCMVGCDSRLPLALKLQWRSTLAGCVVNTLSVSMLAVYMTVVFPPTAEQTVVPRGVTLLATAVYTLIAGLTFYRNAQPRFERMRRWLAEGRPPTADERQEVMRLPVLFARMTLVRWLIAVPLFSLPDLFASSEFALEEAVTITLAGISTSAAVYLTSEWQLRPAFALALDRSAPPEARSLGIAPRLLLTWVLCSGVPILMVALIPVGRDVTDPKDLIAPIWFAAAAAMGAGFVATKLATQAVARPVRQLRRAIDGVSQGDLDVSVPVDDGSEIGRLQAGFNGMVAGLREREQLRDLYGRQVGIDVAREALERGIELGGETREVSALFVDVVGSTQLAHRESPERVVALLNAFFQVVVAEVHECGGMVNKFEGDAALCVFGAPVPQDDHARRALACARRLRARLDELDGGLDAAIGVACGTVVAGNVGAEARFEYTVIGDPVNEAARLTELAKQHDQRLLASGDAVDCAGGAEAARWSLDGEVTLRGRECPTRIAVPAPTRPVGRLRAPADRARRARRLPAR